VREDEGGATLRVRVQPRASRDAVSGERDGAVVVRLTAPPVEGRANAALSRFLGKTLGVAPSRVELVSGASGRDKKVRIRGLEAREVLRGLGLEAGGNERPGGRR
jgi:uncharacterized protein (TIGR00251 family)